MALNLTQATLAEKAGIGVSTGARIKSGQGTTLDNVVRIAIALDMINHFAQLFEVTSSSTEDIITNQNPRLRTSNKNGE